MSTTPAERKALLFLATLLALGAAARAFSGARRDNTIVATKPSALDRQLAAVDSQRVLAQQRRRGRAVAPGAASRRSSRARPAKTPRGRSAPEGPVIVDVNNATAAELEQLPRVGPVLAAKIVQDRETNGPFSSLQELTRVNGIGPKLVMQLAAHVTFSGSVRPPTALSVSPGAAPHMGRSPPPG